MNATARNVRIVCTTGEKVPTAKDALSVLNVQKYSAHPVNCAAIVQKSAPNATRNAPTVVQRFVQTAASAKIMYGSVRTVEKCAQTAEQSAATVIPAQTVKLFVKNAASTVPTALRISAALADNVPITYGSVRTVERCAQTAEQSAVIVIPVKTVRKSAKNAVRNVPTALLSAAPAEPVKMMD